MRTKLIILSLAFMGLCSNSFAQDIQQDAKKAQKELKAAEKAAKKAKKEAKKAAKKGGAVVEAPVNEKFQVPTPELPTEAEQIAYLFGVSQSNGLNSYIQTQMGVDSAYVDDFARGVLERVNVKPEDKAHYAHIQGMSIGGQIQQMTNQFSNEYYSGEPGKKVDSSIVAVGILHGLMGSAGMTAEEANTKFRDMMTQHQEKKNAAAKAEADATEKAFMDENKQDVGIVETASGLQYKVMTEGHGDIPKATDKVKVNYEGRLLDGTVFDSSYKRKEPTSFKVNQVIKGWTEALCLMPVGSKWELYIPYRLAYGERSAGQIPPYSTLIFVVELIDIEK